ncbi:uncharacterized protein LOC114532651 [Dendronephthya gigantea]|uniref:uncharacterized protein LOC114532651 n=1 Tax=Dendronephthya gigantea TaxID=151771 RepID=UPI00106CD1F3|nr:uncharacterized protein LOC114532651 [Dendronephthya gigantea]
MAAATFCLRKGSFKLFSSVSWSSFREMPLEARLTVRLNDMGIENLTEIQQKSLGPILKGDNVIINSETGSGKTLCYLVPVIDKILKFQRKFSSPYSVVLVPNMDLGNQVIEFANRLFDPGLFAQPIHRDSQLRVSPKYPLIVSTPQALMQYNVKSLSSIQTIIIDEADLVISSDGKRFWKLLQSFQDQMKIAKNGPHFEEVFSSNLTEINQFGGDKRSIQFVFAAATLPQRGEQSVFRKILNQFPDINHITSTKTHQYVPGLTCVDVFLKDEEKLPQLLKCLNILNGVLPSENIENLQDFESRSKFTELPTPSKTGAKVLVFANSVEMANRIYEFLNRQEGETYKFLDRTCKDVSEEAFHDSVILHQIYKDKIKTILSNKGEFITKTGPTNSWQNQVGILHKQMSRSERQEVLEQFACNEIPLLVSTDLASRGLDISDISHVIQADYARNAADTLHRAGRTARAGNSGTVINFITDQDKDLWRAMKIADERTEVEGLQHIFSRKRQFSRRIKKRIGLISR